MTGDPKPNAALLEIACFDAHSAITAWKAGADRIELCHGKAEGGITPSLESLRTVKQHVTIPVYLMIRPRGGNFVYSDSEFKQMKADMDAFKPLVDGFVTGILRPDGGVDVERTAELVERVTPLPCTFHRAFDETKDLATAVEAVISTGCGAILSSGGKRTAKEGAATLASLVNQARNRVQILPGGGVRSKNICELREATGASVFHSSGIPHGQVEIDAVEIGRMKALLATSHMAETDGLSRSGKGRGASRQSSSSEDGVLEEMRMSAVSIGGSNTVDVHGLQKR